MREKWDVVGARTLIDGSSLRTGLIGKLSMPGLFPQAGLDWIFKVCRY